MSEYESTLAKARKLLALATRGVGGEAANARALLDAHLQRHGLTLEALADAKRTMRELKCVSRFKKDKPSRNLDLVRLAVQVLKHVTGDGKRRFRVIKGEIFIPQRGLKADKSYRIYLVGAEVTELEWQDWFDCFDHYAPDFLALQTELIERRRTATLAAKMALSGFCHRYDIFPPSESEREEGEEISPEKAAALIAAMRAAGGSKWASDVKKLT